MRKFFKQLKNRKGFTLVELMMVVAVIGILAAVLIPKMGGMKNTAKLSGVDANARQVQAHVNGLIERYKQNSDKFNAALANAINSDDDQIVNPFNDYKGATTAENGKYAVYINSSTPSDNNSRHGLIWVKMATAAADDDDEKLIDNVVITPYDNKGDPMPEIKVTP